MTTTLAQVRAAQPEWFSRANKRIFNDCSYKVLHGKASKKPYLIRLTYMWSDMFGRAKTLCYRVNPLDANLLIRPMVPTEFRNIEEVRDWLRSN